MKPQVIVDTGPLVAFANRRDRYHRWVLAQWARIVPPMQTCEAVLSEACFLLRGLAGGPAAIVELVRRNVLHVSFGVGDHAGPGGWLLEKYAGVPISLADACLVRMTELSPDATLLTLDTDFKIYRKNKRQVIPALLPPGR